MFGKLLLLAVFPIINYSFVSAQDNSCVGLKNCTLCIQNPECAWCSQTDFHGQNKKQLPRCNTEEAHGQLGGFKCSERQLFRHKNNLEVKRNDSLTSGNDKLKVVPIQPQKLQLKLRMNDPVEFNMRYREAEYYPLDLYYLMDGTHTMKDDQEVLAGIGDSIGDRLRKLTNKYQMGFGTFVDKTTSPFISTFPEFLENPCYGKEICEKPYGFKNILRLNNNTRKFSGMVSDVVLSVSSDLPEGGLDALMQVMVCQEQIGWAEQARHLIIFATDAPFHYAGDGRLGGVILPNDGYCHLDHKGEFYTHSLEMDYPSMAQINSKARKHSVTIIFAVTADVIEDYERLSSVIEGSKSAALAKNSSNIADLVEEEYKRITSKVEIKDTFPNEFFKVRYFSRCRQPAAPERETSTCEGLERGTVVEFRVEIELIKPPTEKSERKKQYRIYASGLPDSLEMDVEALVDCPCENPENSVPNSPLCGGKGNENCGLCKCHDTYFGEFCQCNARGKRVDESTACRLANSTEVCSARGNCVCGQCVCSDQRYGGEYCECDNENCRLTNGDLCAGNGVCNCGICQCLLGWSGDSCECSEDTNTCYEPGNKEICSGQGECVCGKCECKGKYSGAYCERCLSPDPDHCPSRCEELKHCVQCKLFQTGVYNPADCELYCHGHSIEKVDVISGTSPYSLEVTCKEEDKTDQCVIIFTYNTARDKSIHIKAQKTKECPAQAPIAWIIGITTAIVVVAGLIILVVFKVIKMLKTRREYRAYKKEVAKADFGQHNNPLYNDPIGHFQNPMYSGVQQSETVRRK